jgi:hypothetical protein
LERKYANEALSHPDMTIEWPELSKDGENLEAAMGKLEELYQTVATGAGKLVAVAARFGIDGAVFVATRRYSEKIADSIRQESIVAFHTSPDRFATEVQHRIDRDPTTFPYFQLPSRPTVNGCQLDDVLEARLAELKHQIEGNHATQVKSEAIHNRDFTMVNWFGTEYHFALGVQSRVVQLLWEEWEKTGLGLQQQTIREGVDAERDNFRMGMLFRNHPAMETMIKSCGDGRYKLCPPDSKVKKTLRKASKKSQK